MNIKVLVVEDNINLNKNICDILHREEYITYSASDGQKAREIYLKEKPHIVLLDIMLPDTSGIDLISLFSKYKYSRILMITALNNKKSLIDAYENGADDYITKPFDMDVLIYKLNVIKKRLLDNSNIYKIGDIELDVFNNNLKCKDEFISIQPSQARCLKLLYEKYLDNTYLSKNEMLNYTSEKIDENSRIQNLVLRLRKQLQEIDCGKVDIDTVYGKGYRLVIVQ